MAGLEEIDCAVIGAGVVGLAVARSLAQAGHDVLILEAANAIGTGASSRNSEVIHAGMYYPPGGLKARFCVEGNRRLRDYLPAHKIPHKMVGKLIVANGPQEEAALETILARGETNGVEGLTRIERDQAVAMEPGVRCTAALHSPVTGIFDSHSYMLALLGEAEEAGAMMALNAPVTRGEITDKGIVLDVGGADPMSLRCQRVVNSAGLKAQTVAACLSGYPAEHVPGQHMCKGNYFTLSGHGPFTHLVYPVPNNASLGLHYTLDLGGQARFGPDVEWIDQETYDVDPARAQVFYDAIRRYWPGLADGALNPAYSGIRAKIVGPESPSSDFQIDGPREHRVTGLVHLFGIESPGLTSSLAIADYVTELLQ
ncbi:MAG TPA: NAD(P)/FAD-dependent oxidoreductase [Magnetospirillaceae bacterium]|jgi:L-2-hydroxyglutarate oxidase LhgO